jgi:hypothetical protein
MSWEDNRRRRRLRILQGFQRLVVLEVCGQYRGQFIFRDGINRNIQYAMGLYEGLNVYGINYVIDPSSSYQDMSGNAAAIRLSPIPLPDPHVPGR